MRDPVNKILIIDDDTFTCSILEKLLTDNGYEADSAFTGSSGKNKLKKKKYDVVLCDFRLPDTDGMKMLPEIRKLNPNTKVIIITAYADVRMAVKMMKSGAYDYVTKPLQPEEIIHMLKRIKESQTNLEGSQKEEFIQGDSTKMREVMKMVALVAPTNMSVLLQGETGSGKEFIARAIHQRSERSRKPFIAVDCGAIPKDLANSELFGHIKGAFTGALSDRKGVFEQANGGSLFLDEIGNLTADIQVRLLRVLQEKVISRTGSANSIPVDVRIIAATNEDLGLSVKEGEFREDLFHRLNELKIEIPPLRDRGEDILLFAKHFMQQANIELGKQVRSIDQPATNLLLSYPWHGNLRELRNIIRRSVLLAEGDTITPQLLPPELQHSRLRQNSHAEETNELGLKKASHQAEKKLIMDTLVEVNYNKSKAARVLNIDRKTLYNKIKQFNINTENVMEES